MVDSSTVILVSVDSISNLSTNRQDKKHKSG